MKSGASRTIAIAVIGCLSVLTCKKSEDTTQFKVTDVSVIDNTVKVKGEITSLSGNKNSEYGICYASKNNPTTADSVLSLGTPKVGTFSAEIKNLSRNHKYYVRAYIKDGGNNLYDDIKLASISGIAPTTLTQAASAVSQTSATINGSVNPNGSAATVSFEYGLTSGYGSTIAAVPNSLSGSSVTTVSAGMGSLTPNTTYHFRVKAVNASGTSNGDDMTFTTSTIATVPVVTTASISAVTTTTATSGGNVTSDGGAAVIARGVCWSTAANPVVTDSKSSDASGTGSFVSTITGLAQGTLYHVRAYATNSAGTAYGSDLSFTTITIPTVTTTIISALTSTSATSGGNISSDGGSAVMARGVCWSTTINPTVSDSKTSDAAGSGMFVSNITGLSQGSVYHVRAYATNAAGTAYGSDIQFTTAAGVTAPVVTTDAITSVTTTSAVSGGNVSSDGGASVTARGVCWSLSANPTVLDSKSSDASGTGTFISNITGLSPGTQYHVRAYATNSAGTSYGSDLPFTTVTSASLPTVTTSSISAITTTSASSGGNVTSDGGAVVTARGVCWSTAANPTIADTKTSDATGSGIFVSSITGLTAGTLYHVRAYATNMAGTSYGSDIPFTTSCLAPSASTNAATVIGSTTVTLNGNVNANGFLTTVTFEYGTTTGYGSSSAGTPGTVNGSTGTAVSAAITGLTPNTLYHFRVNSASCGGTVYGSDLTFTTLCSPPVVTTNAASSIGSSTATLPGSVNANNSSSTVTIEYGTTTGYGSSATVTPGTVTGIAGTSVSANVAGLIPNTLYHFRVNAVNCGGTTNGNDVTFATLCAAPSATTNAATGIGTTTATLPGTVNANYSSTTVSFEYGTSVAYGSTAVAGTVSGNTNTPVSAGISSLTPNTLYHFRVKTVNCGGTVYGSDLTFNTLCVAPAAITNAATVTGTTTASFSGTVNANWGSATVTFEYGTTTGYGLSISATPGTVTGTTNTAVSAGVTGLAQGTLYHYRVKAVTCGGTAYGSDQMFGTRLSDLDGNVYNVVVINSQLWMRENLKVTQYNDGTSLVPYSDTASLGVSYYHYYNNNSAYLATYGLLYNGYVVDGVQNICPTGWHVPTTTDWSNLESFLGGTGAAGGKLKEAGTSHWISPNTGADNSTGFTALPGGQYTTNYNNMYYTGSWWSSGASYNYRYINYNSSSIYSGTGNIESAFYIRCKK